MSHQRYRLLLGRIRRACRILNLGQRETWMRNRRAVQVYLRWNLWMDGQA